MATASQDEVNRLVYFSPQVDRYYRAEALNPAEAAGLGLCEPFTAGAVLDVGVGTGRTTRFLEPRATRYEAIDYSPVMISYMRRHLPGVNAREMDWRDLGAFGPESFDFVFGTDNVIDALAHADRLRALAETARVLRPGGVVAFSSHNLNFRLAFSGPKLQWTSHPRALAANSVQFLLRWRNHRRVGRLRAVHAEYALLNDEGHNYACLHYYATRSTVRQQLQATGFRLLHTIDSGGRCLSPADDDQATPNVLYIAQKS